MVKLRASNCWTGDLECLYLIFTSQVDPSVSMKFAWEKSRVSD